MLSSSQAKSLLQHNTGLIIVMVACQTHIAIHIDSKSIAPQRMNEVSRARQFKTLSAAYSYLRTYLEYRGDVSIRLLEHTTETDDDPPTEQALFV